MTVKCVEPALSEDAGYLGVVYVSAQEDLLFPHVDSCLAMALVLKDGSLRGGHAGAQWGPKQKTPDPHGNAMTIFREMLRLVPGLGDHIQKLILVGDNKTWAKALADITTKGLCDDVLVIDKSNNCAGGVDVTLDPQLQQVTLRKTLGAGLVFQRAYGAIDGTQFEMT